MKRRLISVVFLGLGTLCAQAELSIGASQDNYIHTAGTADGSAATFLVRGKAGVSFSRKGYVRFDLSGKTYDATASATFAITCETSADYAGKIVVLGLKTGFAPAAGILDTDWAEASIDWANAPGNNIAHPYGFDGTTTMVIGDQVLTAGTVVEGYTMEFTIGQLADILQADETVTLMLSSYDSGLGKVLNVVASEHLTLAPPTLTVQTPVVLPEGVLEADQDNSISTAGIWDSTSEELIVRGKAGITFSRKAYTRFDLSQLIYDIESPATFQITCLDSLAYSGKLFVYGLSTGFTPGAAGLDTDWVGTAIDWANAPGNQTDHPYFFDSASTTLIASQQMAAGSITNGLMLEYTIDRLGDVIQADGSVTLMMGSYDNGTGQMLRLASAENATYMGPTLIVDGTAIPPTLTTNGTPHNWLDGYYPGLVTDADYAAQDLTDTDNDGFLAWQEYQLGTDPSNALSLLAITASESTGMGTGFIVKWQSVAGKSYNLLTNINLSVGPWGTTATGIPATGSESAYTTTVENAANFFQVELD